MRLSFVLALCATTAALPAAAGTLPTVTTLLQYGSFKLERPQPGLNFDPNTPVPGAILSLTRGFTKPGAITILTPNPTGTAYSLSAIHSFTGGDDGYKPQGSLTAYGTSMIGETVAGGAQSSGTLFQITPSGSSYSYAKLLDYGTPACPATEPHSSLVAGPGGYFYGFGGGNQSLTNKGQLYVLSQPAGAGGSWSCKVIWSSAGGTDGQNPGVPVFGPDGTMYVTFLGGGAQGVGAVGKLVPSNPSDLTAPWTLTRLHDFGQGRTNGKRPNGYALSLDNAGNLFGTTVIGGTFNRGTYYRLSPPAGAGAWTFTILHNFAGGATDGAFPKGPSVPAAGGGIYLTTQAGGSANLGAIVKLNAAGTGTSVVYSFTGGATDGAIPGGGLFTAPDGKIYGTTNQGGARNLGVLFRFTP